METQSTARGLLGQGDQWTDEVTRQTLPLLLWLAKRGDRLTYKEVGEDLLKCFGQPIQRRYTLYGRPAGKIGRLLMQLSDEWGERIPPIDSLIVNAKTRLPGHGADYFTLQYLKPGTLRISAHRGRRFRLIVDGVSN